MIGEPFDLTEARRQRLAATWPELASTSPDDLFSVDAWRVDNGGAVSAASQMAMRLARFAVQPTEQVDDAPNVIPWTPRDTAPQYDPYSTDALSTPAMPPQQSYYQGAASWQETARNIGRAAYETGQTLGLIGPEWSDADVADLYQRGAFSPRLQEAATTLAMGAIANGPHLPGAGAGDDVLSALSTRLKALSPAERLRDPEFQALQAQAFRPDYNAKPADPVNASDITVNLRRAREADARVPQPFGATEELPLSRADEMQRVREEFAARNPAPEPVRATRQSPDDIWRNRLSDIYALRTRVEELEAAGDDRGAIEAAMQAVRDHVLEDRAIGPNRNYDPRGQITGDLVRALDEVKRIEQARPTLLETARERARQPRVDDGMSQQQAIRSMIADDKGGITPDALLRPAVTNTLGAVGGGVTGYEATPDDAPLSEKLRNAAIGAGAGLGVAAGARGIANDLAARGMPPITRNGAPAYFHDLLADALDLSTGGLRAAFDLSGLRQMAPALAGHPIRGAKAIKQELKALFSEANYAANEARIDAQPWAARRAEAVPDWRRTVDAGAGQLEGQRTPTFLMRAANRLGYRASNRAFVSLLNTMDDELFGMMVQKDGRALAEIPDEVVKQYSTLANISTGRGPLPKGFKNEVGGARLFWAPSLLSSRVMLPVEVLRPSVNNVVRKEAARQLVAFVGVNLAVLKTGEALGAWKVNTDPTNSKFGQAEIGGQTIDPWAGYRPIVNLVARMYTGQVGTAGGGRIDKRREEILTDFLRSKLAPGAGTAWNLAAGKDMVGNDFGPENVPNDLLAPLFYDDIQEAITNGHGIGEVKADPGAAAQRGAIGALSGIGAGVTTRTPVLPAQGYSTLKPDKQIDAIDDQGWALMQQGQGAPEAVTKAGTYYDWRRAQFERLTTPEEYARAAAAGVSRGEVIERVNAQIDKSQVAKLYEETKGKLRDRWVEQNPQLALDLNDKYEDMKSLDEKMQHSSWNLGKERIKIAHRALGQIPAHADGGLIGGDGELVMAIEDIPWRTVRKFVQHVVRDDSGKMVEADAARLAALTRVIRYVDYNLDGPHRGKIAAVTTLEQAQARP